MRHTPTVYGGNLGETNSVAWMFHKKGYIVVEKAKASEDALMSAALDAGADDLRDDGDNWKWCRRPRRSSRCSTRSRRSSSRPPPRSAMLPQNYVKLEGKPAQQMVKLMDILEDHEDSKKVWSNADIEEKEIEASLA